MPDSVRTCGGPDCEFYDPQTQTCGIYRTITNNWKKKPTKARAYVGEACRYGLKTDETIDTTPMGILLLFKSRASPFETWEPLNMTDIDVTRLGLAQRAQTQTQTQH